MPEMKVNRWLEPDNLFLLECWARDLSEYKLAEKIGVTRGTLNTWKAEYPAIKEAISKGREIVDYKVESALLKSALGYKTEEMRITTTLTVEGNVKEIKQETMTKHVAPNTTACAIWLNNRKPDQWKRNRDISIETKEDEKNITVNIINHGQQIDDDWDN